MVALGVDRLDYSGRPCRRPGGVTPSATTSGLLRCVRRRRPALVARRRPLRLRQSRQLNRLSLQSACCRRADAAGLDARCTRRRVHANRRPAGATSGTIVVEPHGVAGKFDARTALDLLSPHRFDDERIADGRATQHPHHRLHADRDGGVFNRKMDNRCLGREFGMLLQGLSDCVGRGVGSCFSKKIRVAIRVDAGVLFGGAVRVAAPRLRLASIRGMVSLGIEPARRTTGRLVSGFHVVLAALDRPDGALDLFPN